MYSSPVSWLRATLRTILFWRLIWSSSLANSSATAELAWRFWEPRNSKLHDRLGDQLARRHRMTRGRRLAADELVDVGFGEPRVRHPEVMDEGAAVRGLHREPAAFDAARVLLT